MKFKILALLTLVAGLTLPSVAQRPGPRSGAREGKPLSRLSGILDLTDAQITSFQTLMESHRPEQQALFEQIRQARETLRQLTDQAQDATAIGNATLEVRRLENELRALREQVLSEFKNLLTTEQREKFETLEELGRGDLLGPMGPGPGGRVRPGGDPGRPFPPR